MCGSAATSVAGGYQTTTPLEELGYPLGREVAGGVDLDATPVRLDQAQRTRPRSLSGMQNAALVTDTAAGTTWRLVGDGGAYPDAYRLV